MRVIAGTAKGTLLKAQMDRVTRPTSDKVKGALFNILGPVFTGTSFLDLFAGSGALGIEALSRGASFAVFVEKDGQALGALHDNLHKTGFASRSRVLGLDVKKALGLLGRETLSFEHIFMDPPYGGRLVGPVLKGIFENGLLKGGGTIIVEHEAGSQAWWMGPYGLRDLRIYGKTALSFLCGKNPEEGEIQS